MKNPRFSFLKLAPVLAFLAFAGVQSSFGAAASAQGAAEKRLPILFVCGDSTAAPSRPPILGWGERVAEFFDPAKIKVENRALGGRSARTFIGEGRWEAVRSQLRPGDVVLLQFGHNDTKSAISIDRYDLPGLGDEVEEATNPRTGEKMQIHTFGYYMGKMIDEGVAAGAKVIVLLPVPRSKWAGGKIVRGEENHGPWAAEVAKARGVPFVDVNGIIADLYDGIGRPRIKALYFPQDNTHTNPAGALVNAASVVHGLLQLNDASLAGYLKDTGLAMAADAMGGVAQAAAAVKLSLPLNAAFPAANATNVPPDTPLRLTFAAPPTLGSAGKIRIVDAADNSLVETIDVSSPTATQAIGGLVGYKYYPVIVAGSQATIFPRHGALAYNKTYYVTVDAGVFKDGSDAFAALDQPAAWRFTTKPAAPAAGSTRLTVAADGKGDFCTVQGALDFIPDGNTTPTTVFIRTGTYQEMVFVTNKNAITLLGEDRKQTVIAYANNARFNTDFGGNPFGGAQPDPGSVDPKVGPIYRRALFLGHRVNDLTIANLTLRNTTPQGGAQAEAIILNGTTTAHAILKDVDLYSFQDTLQINGQAYLNNCFIEGDVDFMWGTGPVFFENCIARSVRSGAFYTQIRNQPTNHGFVYLHCTFDGLQGVMGNYFSRIAASRYPASEVVILDCVLGPAVGTTAWQFQGGAAGTANVHFWEFNSHSADGQPTDVTYRLPGSRQLKQPDDAATIANYSNPAFVLGHDWNPKSAAIFTATPVAAAAAAAAGAPSIVVPPVSQLGLLGTNPYFTVVATGSAGRLSYQWRKNGQPIPGDTQPVLRFENLNWDDAANYTVTVTNTAGSVTSDAAELMPVAPQTNTPPPLPKFPEAAYDVTAYGAVGDGATDNTAAIQRAIDVAVAGGGGIVTIPAAAQPYLSGPIRLGNNINLQVDHGATLRALPFATDGKIPAYPATGERYADFISATGVHDVAITGAGTINGDGEAWWRAFRTNRNLPHRPFLIRTGNCDRVYLGGVTLTRSPMFHAALGSTNNLTVFNLVIDTPEGPNTDGVDPSGSHQLFQNCSIATGDDNIVMKPGGTYCSDITVSDCFFAEGHGMSVGGQSNRGLDGMVIKNCTFVGTTSGLRLKADATEGGDVKNITCTNLTMRNVEYPIVFYSYYHPVGNPGSISGNNLITPEKVNAWNAKPPNSLARKTLPAWKNVTINNVTATGTKGYNIIWGLALDGYLIDNIKLNNVRMSDGPGFEIYNASNVQFTGDTDVGKIITANALAIVSQPKNQSVAPGAGATFTVGVAGTSGASRAAAKIQWTFNGKPLADGKLADGADVSGATGATLTLTNVQAAQAGKYAAVVSNSLDGFDVAASALKPASLAVSATSSPATLTVSAAGK